MINNDMDIKSLSTFVTVARLKSFSKAAQHLHRVQPAISRQIAQLEAQLNVKLFERNTREVRITPAGYVLLEGAEEILQQLERTKRRVIQAGQGLSGELRIGYISSACSAFLPKLISHFRQTHPDITVTLFDMTVQQQLDAFAAQQIDIGFSRAPANSSEIAQFQTHTLYEDHLIAVVPDCHPYATQTQIPLSALAKEPFILFKRQEAEGLFEQVIAQCYDKSFFPTIISQPVTMQTVLTEVGSGLGVSVIPACVRSLNRSGCHFLYLSDVESVIPLQVLIPQNPTAVAQQLFDYVQALTTPIYNDIKEIIYF